MITTYRRFWLQNESGDIVPLNGEHGVLFDAVTGLGYVEDVKYSGNDSGFYFRNNSAGDKQASISGKMKFDVWNPYLLYREFFDWVMSAKTLVLMYQPARLGDVFTRRVEISSVSKSGLVKGGFLVCPIVFLALTPWVTNTDTKADVQRSDTPPFRVGVGRVDVDRLSDGREYVSSLTIEPTGHVPASFVLTHTAGTVLSGVQVSVIGKDTGTEYGRLVLDGNVYASEMLEWCTEPNNSYVKAVRADGERDLLDMVDLEFNPFPLLPVNEAVIITMTTSSMRNGSMKVVVNQYRRAV